MRKNNFLKIIAGMAVLTSCQFNYTLPDPNAHKEASVYHTGYHGAHGCAYQAGRDAALLVKAEDECSDDEWIDEYQDIPGQGYYDGQWSGNHADEFAMK